MIKIYGMATCPDCTYVDEQVKGNGKYDVIDIGAQALGSGGNTLLRARRRDGDVEARRCRLAFALKRI